MPSAMTLISSQTLGSAVSSVTFGSGGTLTQSYRDLYLVVFARSANTTVTADNLGIQFNGDTASNYSWVRAYGDSSAGAGSTGTSGGQIGQIVIAASQSSTDLSPVIFHIVDYSTNDRHKNVLVRSGSAAQQVCMTTGRWANTAAITSFTLLNYASAANFVIGSTFYLYGVAS